MPAESRIYCSATLRALFPRQLVPIWRQLYPELFDEDDERITRIQERNHFGEWLTAIHIYHRDGMLSLVEKYRFANHPRKRAIAEQILTSDQLAVLDGLCKECGTQPPDLLVYSPDLTRFWFAEAKLGADRLSEKQKASHAAIRDRLGVPVEVFEIITLA